ncbi:lipopolysaccharide biosynthesis protein [Liquorilactobacillus cacaonum]|nr:oligosaccharide flippase family protein [Liquorilactobacillus cacaonum]
MNKYKKLVKNSFIFALGNFGSKVLQFALVPLYSYTLSTAQFGHVDLVTTVISLLLPLICFDIYDAVFRFSLDSDRKKAKDVFKTGFIFVMLVTVSMLLILFIFFTQISNYYIVIILLIVTMWYSLISNYVRAIGLVKIFVIAGIIDTFSVAILNIFLLLILRKGVNGYFLSIIGGFVISLIYLLFSGKLFLEYKEGTYSNKYLKNMLVYSIPLIPNSLTWWLNSSSDRYFILLFIGVGANGLYAMASKIPTVVNMFANIFFQSWQMSVVEEYEKSGNKEFITNIFNLFLTILFLCSIGILAIIKPIFGNFIDPTYYQAWTVIPFILLSVIYSSIASFLGTIYTASKRTFPVFVTTLIGAIVNIIASIIFIKILGINGAALANIISFFVVLLIRYRDIYKRGKIGVNYFELIANHVVFLILSWLLFIIKNNLIYFLMCSALILVILFVMKEKLFFFLKLLRNRKN